MFVPDVAVAGAVFTIERSATRWAVVVAMEASLAALVSSAGLRSEERRVGKECRVAGGSMRSTRVKVWVALGARVTKLQVTEPAVVMHPGARRKSNWGG